VDQENKSKKARQKQPANQKATRGARARHIAPKKTAARKVAPPPVKAPKGGTPRTGREGSKTAKILELLQRDGGATLAELMQATEWQAHSVRGFLSGTLRKKMMLALTSIKRENGERSYSIAS
jgi:hypothetical protein